MNSQPQSPQVIVVEASAGSGKTYALAKRYLELLINPQLKLGEIPLRNILAITFTNKATVEMKERILEFLKRIALNIFENKEQEEEIFGSLKVKKDAARQRAGLIVDELINNYTFFQVQTIDSFINTILTGCALNIDRSARFKIKGEYIQYLSYCLDSVIDLAADNRRILKLLEDFLEHYLFIENKDSWFPKKDILDSIQLLFKISTKYGTPFYIYKGKGQDIMNKKSFIFDMVQKLLNDAPLGLNAAVKKSIERFLKDDRYAYELKDIPDSFKAVKALMNKNKECPHEFSRQWQDLYQAITELIELDAHIAYNPYIELYEKMSECFNEICKHEDILFLNELNSKARLLFCEDGITIAELYYRLSTRFAHHLIDEFQDTSKLQWKNLEEMIKEALANGGSLFYVGDKKQAIYRFRGGEVELFDEVKMAFSDYNVKLEILNKNWRSQKAIVEFNNEIFSQENLANTIAAMDIEEDLNLKPKLKKDLLSVFSDTRQEHIPDKKHGYVYVERIEENNKEERNAIVKGKLVSLVNKLHGRFSYKDMAVICRDNEEVELVTSWFLEANITVESEKTLSIGENYLIQELVSLLRFLYCPIDNLSFASFILSDIFTRASAIPLKDITSFIFNLRKEKLNKNGLSLYKLFRDAYPQAWDGFIDEFFKSVGFISPYELVIGIYQRYAVLDSFKDSQAFFMKFLELIKKQEDEYTSLGEFLSYLDNAQKEDLYINVEETNSVHVLTIHKSKGLEFNIVLLPFLRIDINAQSAEIPASYITKEDNRYALVRITKTHLNYSQKLKEIYKEAYIKACIDEFNGLYVALTRAKLELYIFIPKKSANRANKARCLIHENIKERGQMHSYEAKKEQVSSVIKISPSVYKDWLLSLKDEFAESALENREKIIYGNVIHFILSCIDNLYFSDRKLSLAKAADLAKIKYPFIENFTQILEKINTLFDKEEIRPLFYVSEGKVYNEKDIVNICGETKRIDRLIVKDKEVWVVDYKASRQNYAEHCQQLKNYLNITKALYPQSAVSGFLVYLDDLSLEKING